MENATDLQLHTTLTHATVHSGNIIYSFRLTKLHSVEVCGNYCHFHLVKRPKVILHGSLTNFEEQLKNHSFVRVNRSWLVNVLHMEQSSIKEGAILPETDYIPVSRRGMERMKAYHKKPKRLNGKRGVSHKTPKVAV